MRRFIRLNISAVAIGVKTCCVVAVAHATPLKPVIELPGVEVHRVHYLTECPADTVFILDGTNDVDMTSRGALAQMSGKTLIVCLREGTILFGKRRVNGYPDAKRTGETTQRIGDAMR